MKLRKAIKFILPLLVLILASACSAPLQNAKSNPPDPSRPTMESIYYYCTASLMHYEGDFALASVLYKHAEDEDPYSPQIKKQTLINNAHAFLNNQKSSESIVADFNLARESLTFDEDLLSAAYSVYSQAKDEAGVQWTVDQGVTNFPSTRSYLQKFYYDFSRKGIKDTESLNTAYKLAKNNADDLLLTARMYAFIDIPRSIQILTEAKQAEPKPDIDRFLTELLLQFNPPKAREHFLSFSYPEDSSQMLHFLQIANQHKALAAILELSEAIFATHDPNLLAELAFAAYMNDDKSTLARLSEIVITMNPVTEEYTRIATCLLVDAMFTESSIHAQRYADMLYSVQDVDDMLLYRTMRLTFAAPTDTIGAESEFSRFMQDMEFNKLDTSPLLDYLLAVSHATAVNDSTLTDSRIKLCEYFTNINRGYEVDWSLLLTYYHQTGLINQKIPMLRRAIERFPNNPLFLNDLGYSLLDSPNSYAEAGILITRATALEPENGYYQDSMAWYYYLVQDYENALKHIAIPMRMSNPPSEISYHIGMILIANSNNEAAIPFLQAVLSDATSKAYQEKAREALKNLEVKPDSSSSVD
ncbi:MAG: hypothetical protein PHO32_01550 [Candidatus Cloacimonetes bacterium]|nr:hypothetical protein [Candidatus Cloacimonadota bacterium]